MGGTANLGQAYRVARARLRREAPAVCALCGKGIDLDLPRTDPMAWSCDHIIPVSVAPELAEDFNNLQPSHNRCNSKKSNKVRNLESTKKKPRVWLA